MSAWRSLRLGVVAVVAVTVACGGRALGPATLDSLHDACRSCRMTVSDPRFAAQVVAPGEEPLFFDDVGCLATYLREEPRAAQGAVAYVSDHRTQAWVLAAEAVYTRVARLETPMGSHLVAHVNEASRRLDPDAADGAAVGIAEIFGTAGPPGGRESRWP